MSAWERSRYIPWDRIPLPDTRPRGPGEPAAPSLDSQKERVFRELRKEQLTQQEQPESTTVDEFEKKEARVPYSHMDLAKQAAFGGTIGSITGAVFGFMDGMRTAGESSVLQNASSMAKGRYLLQGTTRSATVFGAFFCCFHMTKYGLRVAVLPVGSDYTEIVMAAPLALGALMVRPTTRAALPYGTMLIFMDGCSLYMRKTD